MQQVGEPFPSEELRGSNDYQGCKWYRTEGVHSSMDSNIVSTGAACEYSGPCVLRSFRTAPAISWESFQVIRKGKVVLGGAHEGAIAEDLAKLSNIYNKTDGPTSTNTNSNNPSGARGNDINLPVKSIGKFLEDQLPGLCDKRGDSLYRGATFLLLGVLTGNIALAERCLEWGANPNEMSFLSEPFATLDQMRHGYSPMFVAIITGNIAMMNLLHSAGGSLIVYDRWGRTPLHAALALADREVIQWLVEKGAPRCLGNTAPVLQGVTMCPDLSPVNLALNPRPKLSIGHQVGLPGNDEAKIVDMKEGDTEKAALCHCWSGLPKGYCGCIDDMFLRWSYDRLHSRWQPGITFTETSAAHPSKASKRPKAA
ncbi:Ankyrin repeats (3 copies), putative [Trypanosoma equiperdum]|uniref:Uncharacterized protein n=2 Tax=Trypanozoon TaxID=39700 RepID=Q38BJ4_TRYB2|nr:hypothetical protein, conserved [Trypanosoma brucei brucei TREU927]EAN77826.1 hypothetical protein, conserved [Trypanosoma brucei brucei TREU927]SCU70978.1 Ankyrin repeats (3 copies), putative [Trypanosoma equiperdum]